MDAASYISTGGPIESVIYDESGLKLIVIRYEQPNSDIIHVDQISVEFLRKYQIPYFPSGDSLYVKLINFIDFLASSRAVSPCFNLLRERYLPNIPKCHVVKISPDAVMPSKNLASDEGYDLVLIGIEKVISPRIIRYKTGLRIEPPHGYHLEIVPRSSFSSSGYMLANNVGIIDSGYRGEILVTLIKVDPDAKELELPIKCMQALLRKSIHYTVSEISSFVGETVREARGFGSTGS